jgi:hypothetical protein
LAGASVIACGRRQTTRTPLGPSSTARDVLDDRGDVGAVPGVDEAGDELARAVVAQRRRRSAAGVG